MPAGGTLVRARSSRPDVAEAGARDSCCGALWCLIQLSDRHGAPTTESSHIEERADAVVVRASRVVHPLWDVRKR
jgi:hypothetical protein